MNPLKQKKFYVLAALFWSALVLPSIPLFGFYGGTGVPAFSVIFLLVKIVGINLSETGIFIYQIGTAGFAFLLSLLCFYRIWEKLLSVVLALLLAWSPFYFYSRYGP